LTLHVTIQKTWTRCKKKSWIIFEFVFFSRVVLTLRNFLCEYTLLIEAWNIFIFLIMMDFEEVINVIKIFCLRLQRHNGGFLFFFFCCWSTGVGIWNISHRWSVQHLVGKCIGYFLIFYYFPGLTTVPKCTPLSRHRQHQIPAIIASVSTPMSSNWTKYVWSGILSLCSSQG
jgi:hypothetical protein